jgi:hypothetical protein
VLPLALVAGGSLAALLRGTEAVLERLAARPAPRPPAPAAVRLAARPRPAAPVRAPGLAHHLAGRAPPAPA